MIKSEATHLGFAVVLTSQTFSVSSKPPKI